MALRDLSINELLDYADELGIQLQESMTKDQLIRAIVKHKSHEEIG